MGGAELWGSCEDYFDDISYLLMVHGKLMVPILEIYLWPPGSALYSTTAGRHNLNSCTALAGAGGRTPRPQQTLGAGCTAGHAVEVVDARD